MIEIKNIVKTYHPKKGGAVIALNNVSLKFPEKGLVFILGKSGSGKSTLLNVMGGLDSAASKDLMREVLLPLGYNYIVSSKEIDFVVKKISTLLADSLNNSLLLP